MYLSAVHNLCGQLTWLVGEGRYRLEMSSQPTAKGRCSDHPPWPPRCSNENGPCWTALDVQLFA
jgi:hypothetical protein